MGVVSGLGVVWEQLVKRQFRQCGLISTALSLGASNVGMCEIRA